MDDGFKNIGVLVPAYNAGDTLDALIKRLLQYASVGNILVVDDGSTDKTASVARGRGVQVISLETNRGKGVALSKGFEILRNASRFDNVVTLDADLQHAPEHLPDFIRMKSQSGADIVVGVRKRIGTDMPLHRRMSNAITSFLVSVRTGEKILDSQCGFRLIGMNVLSAISLDSTGFEAETEFLIKAIKHGFSVHFVQIETVYNGARSHMTNWRTTVNFVKVLLREY